MSSSVRWLIVAALGVAALASCLLLLVNTELAPATGAERVVQVFRSAFADGAWRWLLDVTIPVLAGAVFLSLVDLALQFGGGARRRGFGALDGARVRDAVPEIRRRVEESLASDRPDVVTALDEMFKGAHALGASDLHITPTQDGGRATYRLDGTLHEVATFDAALAPRFATRVKVLARLDTYVRAVPQDGRLARHWHGGFLEARVSTLPTELGERIALRIVRGGRKVPDVAELGFAPPLRQQLEHLLGRPQGMLFVTGPVGSGKTTTLYSALKHIAENRGRTTTLVSLEDPVEIELAFATQTAINTRTGMTFAGALRSVLRQDPNVLMVGEIRDRETAEIAAQAGLTGHLILTTVHAEGAAGPFARLIDMQVEPFVISSAALGCLSQRLVRTLCTACRREVAPDLLTRETFEAQGIELGTGPYYEAPGCDFCEEQGFVGRAPIAELLTVDESIREAITARKSTGEIYALARQAGMTTLLLDGVKRAASGATSLKEVLRVAG